MQSYLSKIAKFGLFIAFFIMLFSNVKIYAQPDECFPNMSEYVCENHETNSSQSYLCGIDQQICRMDYSYKVCKKYDQNGEIIDRFIQLNQYFVYPGCLCLYGIEERMISAIISKNKDFFEFDKDSCWTEFKVQTAICWEDILGADGSHLLRPCPIVGCCLSKYTVCFDYRCTGPKCKLVLSSIDFASNYSSGVCGLPLCESMCVKLLFSSNYYKKNEMKLNSEDDFINLYPNPVRELLNINTNLNLKDSKYKIYNINGDSMQSGNFELITGNSIVISISELNNGTYNLQITKDQQIFTIKFIK